MKASLLHLLKTYLLFILIFVVQKPLFMIYYHDLYREFSFSDYVNVIFHGLWLDASMAGYLTMLPGIFLIFYQWIKPPLMNRISMGYFGIVSGIISIDFVADINLYRYWGFRLDSTPLFYLTSMKNAMASVNWMVVVGSVLAMILIATVLTFLFYHLTKRTFEQENTLLRKVLLSIVLLLATGLLFIPIRGGFTASTMNVGKVYFSNSMALNHAAINPLFSFFESLTKQQNFKQQYRFMTDEEAKKEFATMTDKPVTDSIPRLFNIKHPNIVLIVLENFISTVISPLGGIPDVAVRINGFCEEGILFTNFYANSFRTDRGLVSIYSGYPAQPTTSIMKYPRKTQRLPSIPKSLKRAGYNLQYYYGGDADFTNMRSYLLSMGIENIVSDADFPLKDRLTKWGAPDHVVCNRLTTDLNEGQQEPFMKIFQTLSSHEPFEVPMQKFKDPYLNAVAYTDSCLGVFIEQFKKTPWWKNSIVIMVADHAARYPDSLDNRSPERHQIPLLIIGGAVKRPCKIDTYASQIDIAATLLAQFQIPHADFIFSKNILHSVSPHFGYYTFPNGFAMVTPDNRYVYDCESNSVVLNSGEKNKNKKKAEALLQILYDDLEKR